MTYITNLLNPSYQFSGLGCQVGGIWLVVRCGQNTTVSSITLYGTDSFSKSIAKI